MNTAKKIVEQLLAETGEPDQDYDHEFYNKIVKQLAAAGFPGATHKEFDKYRGVSLTVPGVGKFWPVDSYYTGKRTPKHPGAIGKDFQYEPGTESFHMVLQPERENDGRQPGDVDTDWELTVTQRPDGTVDADELLNYVKSS